MYLDDIDDPLENFLPQRHQGSVPHARRVQQAGGDVQLLGFLQPKGMPGLKWTNFEERNPIFFERQTCGNLMMLDLVAKLYDGNKGCTSYFAGRWQRLVWLTSDICFDLNIACSRVCFLVLRKSCFTGLWLFPQALFPQMSWGKTMKSWMRIIASMRAQFDSICLLFVFNSATAGQLLFGWYALWLQGPFALDSARWSFFFSGFTTDVQWMFLSSCHLTFVCQIGIVIVSILLWMSNRYCFISSRFWSKTPIVRRGCLFARWTVTSWPWFFARNIGDDKLLVPSYSRITTSQFMDPYYNKQPV